MNSKSIKKARSLIVLFLLVFLFSSATQKNNSLQRPQRGGVFHIKLFADHFKRQLDPLKQNSFIFVSEQLYDGLVRLNKNFNIEPSLAEYWEISPDGKIYTFHLKKGVHFHHGKELTASDVKYSLERILVKENGSPYYQYFMPRVQGAQEFREGRAEHVSGFRIKDRYTFEIIWTKPYVSALYLLSMHFCKVLPKELHQEMGEKFFLDPSGTGPFVFEFWLRDTRLNIVGVRLKRNEFYFKGSPYLDAVEFCPLYSLEHFLNEEIDSIPLISSRLLNSKYQVFEDGSINMIYLGMSCHLFPLDSSETRKALSLGINKDDIIQKLNDPQFLFQTTHNYIPHRLPGFFPIRERSTDLEEARQILNQQGFSKENRFPVLYFFMPLPKSEDKYSLFKCIRSQLETLGIKIKLRYFQSVKEIKNCQIPFLFCMEKKMNFPDPEDIVRTLFYSQSMHNLFFYKNSEVDRLLKNAELEASWSRRIEIFQHIEEILLSDVPAVPLFSRQNRLVMQPYVRGVDEPALGFYYLEARKIWLDK
jgi:ABC-type transport system substrate-binding protein